MKVMKLILLNILLLLTSVSLAAETVETDWYYTVKAGDRLQDLCDENVDLPQAACLQKLKHYNRLSSIKLKPGQVLKMPVAWLQEAKSGVEVLSAFGEVFYKKSGGKSWAPLAEKDTFYALESLKTKQGNVRLKFDDGSIVTVSPETELLLAVLEIGGKSTGKVQLFLIKGSIDSRVQKRQEDSFEIRTPVGVAAVRGTEFRVRVTDDGQSLFSEVLEGQVQVSQDASQQLVEDNFGVKSVLGLGVSEPEQLLKAPVIKSYTKDQTRKNVILVDWNDVRGAKQYQYELYRGDELVVKNQRTQSHVYLMAKPGDYRIVIRAIDEKGFQGKDVHLNLDLDAS